jgi:hypothetical protein
MNELAARVLARAIGSPGWMTLKTKRGFVCGPTVMFTYCEDCDGCLGTMGEWFQLKNAVWNQAWPGTAQRTSAKAPLPMKHFLCIGCVEKRLGRKLSRRDFDMRRKINRTQWRGDMVRAVPPSKRMLERLARR